MYLIHLVLRPPAPAAVLPPGLAEVFLAAARPEERVEHVSVHPDAQPYPVIGVYLTADHLTAAEECAGRLGRRVLGARPALAGWAQVSAAVPLLAPFFELSLLGPGRRPGRNGPRTNSSN
jgi:hypothetical protein